MARLNEPLVSSESLDSLKRRFVSQNRSLAKCNSQQSIKIRALETDLHHILSENATLRVRVNSLETELADIRTLDIRSGVAQLRNRLTSQFASIVAELADLERKPRRRKSQLQLPVSPKRSPLQREWRNTSTLGEVLASQGATLPTIVEGKHFPRRTMDMKDVQELIAGGDADSPEVGPPPRTFLDEERDREIEYRLASPKSQSPEEGGDRKVLFDAVEIRRRRRSSKIHNEDANGAASVETSHPLKAGAKRKMDFTEGRSEAPTAALSPRKVLGDKSVNTDPVVTSPQKVPQPVKDPVKPISTRPVSARPSVRATDKDKTSSRPPSRAARTPIPPQMQPNATIIPTSKPDPLRRPSELELEAAPSISIKLEPKTPLGLDLFSPTSAKPSAPASAGDAAPARPATPPPSNITASTTSASTDAAAGGRGSRRGGRPAVSYAEPKLNVKMRREGKEMADAIVAKREDGRSMSREPEAVKDKDNLKIKLEEMGRDSKAEDVARPASPLDNLPQSKSRDPQQLLDIFDVENTPPRPTAAKARPSLALAASTRPTSPKGSTTMPSRTERPASAPPARPLSLASSVSNAPRSSSTTTGSSVSNAPKSSATSTSAATPLPARKDRRQTVGASASAHASAPADTTTLSSSGLSDLSATPPSSTDAPMSTQSQAPREVRVRSNVRRTSSVSNIRPRAVHGKDDETAGSGGMSRGTDRDVSAANLRAERAGRIAERRKSMML